MLKGAAKPHASWLAVSEALLALLGIKVEQAD